MKNQTVESFAQSLWAQYMKTLFGAEKYTNEWEELHHTERNAWWDVARAAIDSERGLKDEIERMTAERDALKAANQDLQDWYDAASADAKRYQWLRKTTSWVSSKGSRIDVRKSPELWDAAIDAAMKGEQP